MNSTGLKNKKQNTRKYSFQPQLSDPSVTLKFGHLNSPQNKTKNKKSKKQQNNNNQQLQQRFLKQKQSTNPLSVHH